MKEKTTLTDFGILLSEAIDEKKNDINQFVWKESSGTEIRMLDMNASELQKAYNHVSDMLWNKRIYSPGKYKIKENIKRMEEDCNAELLLRYILYELDIDILKTNRDLLDLINQFRSVNKIKDDDSVSAIFDNLPSVFESVSIIKLVRACFDRLGIINKKIISDKFILSQGIWLTNDEKQDLTEYDENGRIRNYMEVIKERLFLNNIRLYINESGLSYTEFRSLIKLEPFGKVSEVPTNTLKLLRDKILPLLDINIDYHITKWVEIKEQLEKVAEYKNIELKKKDYSENSR